MQRVLFMGLHSIVRVQRKGFVKFLLSLNLALVARGSGRV